MKQLKKVLLTGILMNKDHLEIQQIKLAYQKKQKKIKTIKVKPKSRDLFADAETILKKPNT